MHNIDYDHHINPAELCHVMPEKLCGHMCKATKTRAKQSLHCLLQYILILM